MKHPVIFCDVAAETNQMCGVAVLKNFSSSSLYNSEDKLHLLKFKGHLKFGTGYVQAGFVDNVICKQAYNVLCSKWPLIFQSEVRKNRRTGNKFFFAVFDIKPRGK